MKDLNKLYYECKTEAMLALIPFNPKTTIEWYNAKSNWGRCWNGNSEYPSIQISKKLSIDEVNDKAVKETILHELIHTCKNCQDHGDVFKDYAGKLNKKYGYNIKRCNTAAEKGIDKRLFGYDVEVICTGCEQKYFYKHTSKLVKRQGFGYRCPCGCNDFKFKMIGG